MANTRHCLYALVSCIVVCVAVAAPSGAPQYTCDPGQCSAPDCRCASLQNPGGFTTAKTPQFVLVTFDDSILPEVLLKTDAAFPRGKFAGHKSANGCGAKFTFYTMSTHSYFSQVNELWADGHEIACHTTTHNTNYGSTREQLAAEILSNKLSISRLARIPESHIKGYRAPSLEYSNTLFKLLADSGFSYDSSIREYGNKGATWGALLSDGRGNKIWPYTMDQGVAQHCDAQTLNDTWCPDWRGADGLWEVPVYSIDDANDVVISVMDNLNFAQLKDNFDARYAGNRAPFGLYLHPVRTDLDALEAFMDYAESKEDVYFVTVSQLIAYMKQPKDTDHMHELLPGTCDVPGAGPGFAYPEAACVGTEECFVAGERFHTCTGYCPAAFPSPSDYKQLLCSFAAANATADLCDSICADSIEGLDCEDRDCEVSEWSAWECVAPNDCGAGNATRSRSVSVEQNRGGAACPELSEEQPCDAGACNRDCEVSEWSGWGTCSHECGGEGMRNRTRSITLPERGTGVCEYDFTELETCNRVTCPVDCVTSEWGAWSSCDAACGAVGSRNRSRSITVEQAGAGAACGALTDEGTCQGDPCPVHCVMSQWSGWGPCDAACGGGSRNRTRSATTLAAHGGTACPSLVAQSEICNLDGCDGSLNANGPAATFVLALDGTSAAQVAASAGNFTAALGAVSGCSEVRFTVVATADVQQRLLRGEAGSAAAAAAAATRRAAASTSTHVDLILSDVAAGNPAEPSPAEGVARVEDAAVDGSLVTELNSRGIPATGVSLSGAAGMTQAPRTNTSPFPPPADDDFAGQEAGAGLGGPLGGSSSLLIVGVAAAVIVCCLCAGVLVYMKYRRKASRRVATVVVPKRRAGQDDEDSASDAGSRLSGHSSVGSAVGLLQHAEQPSAGPQPKRSAMPRDDELGASAVDTDYNPDDDSDAEEEGWRGGAAPSIRGLSGVQLVSESQYNFSAAAGGRSFHQASSTTQLVSSGDKGEEVRKPSLLSQNL